MPLEFRIPISPTRGFFSQIRFFNFALRRLGSPYDSARLRIVVGDNCDIDAVRAQNDWSSSYNIVWHAVPADIFDRYGIWGTANWRLILPPEDAEVIVLSDADTVLTGAIDPLPVTIPNIAPVIAGHMAHFPPPVANQVPDTSGADFWPWLFAALGVPVATFDHRYSMDGEGRFPAIPAYFNLGFIALNRPALEVFGSQIMAEEQRIAALTESNMRCQLAMTTIAYRANMEIVSLPAEYNLANDLRHLTHIGDMNDVRVIHYLRNEEMDRSRDLLPENIRDFVARRLSNPVNVRIQDLAREYLETTL